MFRWIARTALFRILPRRALPLLAAVDLFLLVRGLRNKKQPVNAPSNSRTAPPPQLPRSARKR